jgi:hypothetical protein
MSDAGKWMFTMNTPMGPQKFTVEIKVGGAFTSPLGDSKVEEVTVDGNSVTFSTKLKTPMGEMKFPFTGTIDGNKISGTCKTPMGRSEFSGDKA